MKDTPAADGIKEYTLDSWKEFFELTNKVFAAASAFVYRGQAHFDWPLRSGLARLRERFPKRKNLSTDKPPYFNRPPLKDDQQLSAFKRAIRGRRGPNPPPITDDDDYWALGQHHGLATPLLDFTRVPFVALFFAFDEEEVVIDRNLRKPEFRGVFALSTSAIDDPIKHPAKPVSVVSPDSDANYRLISQGALLVKLPDDTDLEDYVRAHFVDEEPRAVFTKVKIPNDDRDGCLVALNKMNINHMTLFPDIEGAAKYVNSLWQPGHEDLIAWLKP